VVPPLLGATILGFKKHKLELFSLFVPSGCPLGLLPLLVLIEFISYLSRAVSLGLRLAANIVAGHLLLAILSGFTFNIMASGIIFFLIGLLPLAFIIAFCGLEIAISFIQAQVFVVLTSSYIKDALDLHGDGSSSKKVVASTTFILSPVVIKTAPHGKAKTLNPTEPPRAGGGQRRFCSTMSLKARGTSSVNTKKLDP
jgi:hypothetical protein